jgi:hypothetical protein
VADVGCIRLESLYFQSLTSSLLFLVVRCRFAWMQAGRPLRCHCDRAPAGHATARKSVGVEGGVWGNIRARPNTYCLADGEVSETSRAVGQPSYGQPAGAGTIVRCVSIVRRLRLIDASRSGNTAVTEQHRSPPWKSRDLGAKCFGKAADTLVKDGGRVHGHAWGIGHGVLGNHRRTA